LQHVLLEIRAPLNQQRVLALSDALFVAARAS
jgi:hypothetical protein